jgi:subtilase family serine protease
MISLLKSTRLHFVGLIVLLSELPAQSVTLSGHVPPILSQATVLPRTPPMDQDPLTVCVMLNLSDRAAYEAFRRDFNDPNSPNYRKPISGSEFTGRFGPSPEAYAAVLDYFQQKGFYLAVGSANRRTLTFHGTRAQGESAFNVRIDDYQIGTRTFHAIAGDPVIPPALAPLIAGVSGLSNPGRWQAFAALTPPTPASIAKAYGGTLTPSGSTNSGGLPPGIDGTGQTVGILSFYSYDRSYIKAWLTFAGLPASLLSHVVDHVIDAGPETLLSPEPLLDIESVLGMAPGATVVVYLAPHTDAGLDASDDYTPIAAAVDNMWSTGGIISTSYGLCESEITSIDAAAMDSLLESASFVGITLFAATGDTGKTCADHNGMHSNTVPYPASVPHAIAVGGTILTVKPGGAYSIEDSWSEPSGNGGGYGISKFFKEPSYQDSFYKGAGGRSIPDVAMAAFPGIVTCMDSVGLLNCKGTWGGTSMAAPLWAGIWALASQAQVHALGHSFSPAGDYFYKISDAFHSASSITGGSFANVGLGSPIISSVIAKGVPPLISSYSPTTGPASGGTELTIKGIGFIGVEKVNFSGTAGTHLTIHSDTELTVETPVASSGTALIDLVTPASTALAAVLYTYQMPSITSIAPAMGPTTGGTAVAINGAGLGNSKTSVMFGGLAATAVNCTSPTYCTMKSPAHAAGPVLLTVKVDGFTSAPSTAQFTYIVYPKLTGISPASGKAGDTVTLTGSGFIPADVVGTGSNPTTFSFSGQAATGVNCTSTTKCTAIVPPSGYTQKDFVKVTVNGITSLDGVNFTYSTHVVIPPCKGKCP